MSYARFLARRAAFALVSAYLVVTVVFLLVTLMVRQELDELLARARFGGATEAELERIREGFVTARGLDRPLLDRYLDWLVDVTTLEWGYSFAYGEPVVAVLDGRVQTTLGYVLPGVALAAVLGVVVGLFAALHRDSAFDWTARLASYVLFGVPAFMFVVYVLALGGTRLTAPGGVAVVLPAVPRPALAALTVAVSLLAGQVRFARTAALEQTGREFVKLVRAKGASRWVLARHVLRNAALPLVSLSVTELLAVLVLDIYVVEEVLRIDGLARASLRAISEGDVALVVWTTMVVVFVGVTGNFLQDVCYGYLDPRVRTG